MRRLSKILAIFVCILASAGRGNARDMLPPQEYGRVVIANHSRSAGRAPVVFDHWLHRARFTCRLCHVDIGFAMKAGATDITAATNAQGFYCGACHDGKRRFNDKTIFASCSGDAAPHDAHCQKCHSWPATADQDRKFSAFAQTMPRGTFGDGIDWEAAESRGLIKPSDFLEGLSIKRPPLKAQQDFSIEPNVSWVSNVVFSHKKHAVWNGCEVCHPSIFPVKKGATKYTMLDIESGEYCGVCHDKVAFPLVYCERCHSQARY